MKGETMRKFDSCTIILPVEPKDDNGKKDKDRALDLIRERVEDGWEVHNTSTAGNKIVYIMRKPFSGKKMDVVQK